MMTILKTNKTKPSVGLLSLGCARNLVDSEVALGGLLKAGYPYQCDVTAADIAIVNTCGFTNDAKKESIDSILELAELKKQNKIQMLIVMGCLSQRYPEEISKEINEADIVLGTNNFNDLASIIDSHENKPIVTTVKRPQFLPFSSLAKKSLTPSYYTYIKISEGCINACSYCAIPSMKGKHRSRSIDDILVEAKQKAESGALREINIIGQDTAAYGWDFDKTYQLPKLLEALAQALPEVWIRTLYAHPAHVEQQLLDVIKKYDNICNYIDLPIEHSHTAMLKRMNRGINRVEQDKVIHQIRQTLPDLALRTAVIVGFPGETEQEFDDLLQCMKEVEFDRLGAFTYSREEGTRAFDMLDQISEEVCAERFRRIMDLQESISLKQNKKKIGKTIKVLVEEESREEALYLGRSQWEAPDVDGQILIKTNQKLSIGKFIDVIIQDAYEHDVCGVPA